MRGLDSVLQEIMSGWGAPGMAVGVVRRGEILYAQGFGVQSLETMTPVTASSVFSILSISKCFVATAVMQLVDSGVLDLDAPLTEYLPYFAMDDHRYRQITVRHALSHTSGMPDMEEHEYIELVRHPESDDGAAERYVRNLRSKRLIADPGERFSYSNIAYNVLGDLLAKATSRPFEDVMRDKVLLPSGMLSSTFVPDEVPPEVLAWPHLRSPAMRISPVYPYHRADAPASFLHTTVTDMLHWCLTCLGRGSYLGRSILSPAGFELMWKPVVKRRNPPDLYEQMALGWNLGHHCGARTVSHGGGGFGGTAFMLLMPENDCAVAALCNAESSGHIQTAKAVANALLGQPQQANRVSWMVPISHALARGGIEAAYACYSEILGCDDKYYFGEYELLDLSLQLHMANQTELAVDVLGLNLHVYPEHIETYLNLASMYRHKGDVEEARRSLARAAAIEPANATVTAVLDLIRKAPR